MVNPEPDWLICSHECKHGKQVKTVHELGGVWPSWNKFSPTSLHKLAPETEVCNRAIFQTWAN